MGVSIGRYEILATVRVEPLGRLLLVREPDLERRFYVKELCAPAPLVPEEAERLRAAFREETGRLVRAGDSRLLRPFSHGVGSGEEPFLVFECPEEAGAVPLCEAAAAWSSDEALQSCAALADVLAALVECGILPPAFEPSAAFVTTAGEVRYLHTHFGHLAVNAGLPVAFCAPDPQWAAPEVLLGQAPSPASVTFSLACWVHGVLTGAGESPVAALLRGEELAPVRGLNAAVDDLLRAALARDPALRTAHPALLAAGLRNASTGAGDRTLVQPAAVEPTVTWRPEREPVSPFTDYLRWGIVLGLLGGAAGWIAGQVLPPR